MHLENQNEVPYLIEKLSFWESANKKHNVVDTPSLNSAKVQSSTFRL